MVYVAKKKKALFVEIKPLRSEVLHLTVNDDDDDANGTFCRPQFTIIAK